MAAPKAQTLQQRFGFQDLDLLNQTHDDIMVWLDTAVDTLLPQWLGIKEDWDDDEVYIFKEGYSFNTVINDEEGRRKIIQSVTLPPKPKTTITKKIWEFPVIADNTSRNKYTIGFVDMVVYYNILEVGINANNLEVSTSISNSMALFEVKTFIPSLGELIRQIHMYQTYIQGNWLVVSPDDRFSSAIKGQGIHFIKY